MITPLLWLREGNLHQDLSCLYQLETGYNKIESGNLVGAKSDDDVIKNFLMRYLDSEQTYESYLKAIERFLLWCIYKESVSLSAVTFEHLREYKSFLRKPTPKKEWCGQACPKILASGEFNPMWRPFVAGLTESSINHAFSVIDRLFNYLVQIRYLMANPLSVDKRRKKPNHNARLERWLEKDEINTTLQALDEYSAETEYDKFNVLRAKYIILTLFYTGLRRSELATHRMGDFSVKNNEWFLKITGKGEKPRTIAIPDEYKDILIQFRQSIELPAFPDFDEEIPLVPASDKLSPLTSRRISQIIKWAFKLGAEKFDEMSLSSELDKQVIYKHKASRLLSASAHWLRHSYGTYLVKKGTAIEKVQALMGHSDISTTMIYVHIANDELHEAARDLSVVNESDQL